MQRPNEEDRFVMSAAAQANSKPIQGEFGLTILSEAGLSQRLVNELRFVLFELRQNWPAFKRDPIGFTAHQLIDLLRRAKRLFARPHVLKATVTALLLVCFVVIGVVVLERRLPRTPAASDFEELTNVATIDLSLEQKPQRDSGVGAGQKGRIGFDNGKGEGSKPEPARAHGGGGSGDHDPRPSRVGKIPLPSEIVAPVPAVAKLNPPLPAGIDIDPALWKDLPFRTFGDPRSKSEVPSKGPGNGGAIGSGDGLGFGEGHGPGFGPGRDGNIGGDTKSPGSGGKSGGSGNNPNPDDRNRVYSSPQLTERARVLFKPEPQYTEEARKQDITGTVILRVVFSSSGEVTNIRAMQTLPGGLTEKAIAAARQIRFVPAKRDGHPVSMYMQLEYNFNLY